MKKKNKNKKSLSRLHSPRCVDGADHMQWNYQISVPQPEKENKYNRLVGTTSKPEIPHLWLIKSESSLTSDKKFKFIEMSSLNDFAFFSHDLLVLSLGLLSAFISSTVKCPS